MTPRPLAMHRPRVHYVGMRDAPSSVDSLFLAFQESLAGRYSLDRELGRGGMGVVYLAREVHLDRLVAIKLLPPARAATPGLRERFLNEARLAAKLSHPNIIPIHAVEDAGQFVFYVMSYVEGETLAQRVLTRGPLPSAEGARVLREVAWALAYAHGQGVVHRDIKPDNILLEGATSRVLVADFGIAGAFGATADGVAGTPEFMSPEQVLGKQLDARSDLYSLGATAFYAFCGKLPVSGATPTEVLARQVTEAAPLLGSMGMPVPRKLAAVVDRCLAKDPAHRPESAQALAEYLGTAIQQRRELPAALRSFVKRNGRLDGGGTLITGFLMLPVSGAIAAAMGSAVAGFGMVALVAIVAPYAYMVAQARRLLKLGFGVQDLEPAFRAESESVREELAITHHGGPSVLERIMPSVARITWAVFGVSLTASFLLPELLFLPRTLRSYGIMQSLQVMSAFAFISAILSSLGALAYLQQRKDVDTEFWAKIWLGRIGRSVFTTAKRFLGRQVVHSAMTHRATELSLGMAAEQLFESLPRETRQSLGELPEILRRLQSDAQALRQRHDDLQDAINAAGGAAASAEYAEVRATRDTIHAKLGETVGALETIRLNLLRLHAGSLSVQGLTTHLGLAADVSAQVERLIAAHDEVAAFQYPAPSTPTPV